MARIATATANVMLAAGLVPGTTYDFALYASDPGTTGASGEVTGGTYSRQSFTFTTASGGQESNVAAVVFTGMPFESGGVPYCAVFTTGATYLGGGTTSGLSGAITAGSAINFAIGAIVGQVA